MKTAKIILLNIFVIIVICVATGLYVRKIKNIEKKNCKDELRKTTMTLDILQAEKMLLLENENFAFIDSMMTVTNLQNKNLFIQKAFADKSYLCLFISASYCGDCVNYSLSELKGYISKNKTDRIRIFASGYKPRELYVFAKDNALDVNSFFIIDKFNFPVENLQRPYFFLINNNKPSHFFIPRKESPSLTKEFFGIVFKNK
jgi:hypothetical protein